MSALEEVLAGINILTTAASTVSVARLKFGSVINLLVRTSKLHFLSLGVTIPK